MWLPYHHTQINKCKVRTKAGFLNEIAILRGHTYKPKYKTKQKSQKKKTKTKTLSHKFPLITERLHTFWPSSNFLSTSMVKGLAMAGGSNICWYFCGSERETQNINTFNTWLFSFGLTSLTAASRWSEMWVDVAWSWSQRD